MLVAWPFGDVLLDRASRDGGIGACVPNAPLTIGISSESVIESSGICQECDLMMYIFVPLRSTSFIPLSKLRCGIKL